MQRVVNLHIISSQTKLYTMNIYLLTQTLNIGYDTYDSCVVAAANEQDAVKIHPSEYIKDISEWGYEWVHYSDRDKVEVKLLGKAAKGIKEGLIWSSFNAG